MGRLFTMEPIMDGLQSIGDAMPLVKAPCEKLVAVDWDSAVGFHDGVTAVAGIKNSLEDALACLSALHDYLLLVHARMADSGVCCAEALKAQDFTGVSSASTP